MGTLTILAPSANDDLHAWFRFLHNDAEHYIKLVGTKPPTWPPTTSSETVTELPGGDWGVNVGNKDKKNQGTCTGEGVGITWTATVTLL